MKKIIFISILLVFLLACCIGGYAIYWFGFTTEGAKWSSSRLLLEKGLTDKITINKIMGNLYNGVIYEEVNVSNIKPLPYGSHAKIQRVLLSFNSLDKKDVNVSFNNGRLFLSYSDPVLIEGKYKKGILKCNFFGRYLEVEDLSSLIPIEFFKKLSGSINKFDVLLSGSMEKFNIKGYVYVDNVAWRDIKISKVKLNLDLTISKKNNKWNLDGKIVSSEGQLVKFKAAPIQLENSSVVFKGDPSDPVLNIKGNSVISGTKIKIFLEGEILKPRITLTSVPSLPQDRLLLMLATNKKWPGAEDVVADQNASFSIAKDFVDYFLFANQGGSLSKKLGISNVQFDWKKDRKQFGITKSITGNIDATYGIEQALNQTTHQFETKQTLGGALKLINGFSVSGETELPKAPQTNTLNDPLLQQEKQNGKILLKYQKSF